MVFSRRILRYNPRQRRHTMAEIVPVAIVLGDGTQMTLRSALPADAEQVHRLNREVWSEEENVDLTVDDIPPLDSVEEKLKDFAPDPNEFYAVACIGLFFVPYRTQRMHAHGPRKNGSTQRG